MARITGKERRDETMNNENKREKEREEERTRGGLIPPWMSSQ